jgi:hypothetical protein
VTVRNIWVGGGTCTTGPLVSRYWWKGDANVTATFRFADNGQVLTTPHCWVPRSQPSNYVYCWEDGHTA